MPATVLSQPQLPRTRAAGDEHTILRDGVAHRDDNIMTSCASMDPGEETTPYFFFAAALSICH